VHILYDKKGGSEYAKLCTSVREGNKVKKGYTNLGRVIDKESGVYQNRQRGVFTYNLQDGTYGTPDSSFVPPQRGAVRREKLILDFGDVFFLDAFIRLQGLIPAIDALGLVNPDTLRSMICYYVLCSTANCHANDRWDGSYARILYPAAKLSGQRISDFLAALGDEGAYRDFFGEYLKYITDGNADGANILIDSSGLPNSIHFPLTAISNHNGEINNEARVIYVTQQETGLPIFFRYCPGNVIDTTTLIRTIAELKANGVNTKFAILDAGYYDDANIKELYAKGISFITRMKENRKLCKRLVAEYVPGIERKDNFVAYNSRYAYIERVECELVEGERAYAYVGLDIDRKSSESRKLFQKAKANSMKDSDVFDQIQSKGIFVLVSSRPIAKDKILPNYYMRQEIEQIFDISKNYADMLPLRVQSEATFRGHLLLTFMATVVVKLLQNSLKNTVYNPISLFLNLRNQKCKVYDDVVITQEAFKKANDCYKIFNLECPVTIPRNTDCG
jgi:hypothetical protein